MCKRLVDLVGATIGLALFSPVIGVAALAVLLAMGRPVFFRQTRPGLNGEPFVLFKLRTMTLGAVKGPEDDSRRLTRLGRLLRRTSIDELPQLWNVLRGDMSLVGPRPLLTQYLPLYTPRQARRHEVSPGITGWAQVNGRNELSWAERLELDVWYVENRTCRVDFRILAKSLVIVLRGRGLSEPGVETSRWFRGDSDSG